MGSSGVRTWEGAWREATSVRRSTAGAGAERSAGRTCGREWRLACGPVGEGWRLPSGGVAGTSGSASVLVPVGRTLTTLLQNRACVYQ